jgi:hypothetical protein
MTWEETRRNSLVIYSVPLLISAPRLAYLEPSFSPAIHAKEGRRYILERGDKIASRQDETCARYGHIR